MANVTHCSATIIPDDAIGNVRDVSGPGCFTLVYGDKIPF
jgi:hypothetical protein